MSRRLRYILIVAFVILAVTGWRVYANSFPNRPPDYESSIISIHKDTFGIALESKDHRCVIDMIVIVRGSTRTRGNGPLKGQKVRVWTDGGVMDTDPGQVNALYIQYGD